MINAFDIRYIHSSLEGIKGVTQDQIENERKGRLIRQYNEDEILEMTAWFEKKRKSQKKAAEAVREPKVKPIEEAEVIEEK